MGPFLFAVNINTFACASLVKIVTMSRVRSVANANTDHKKFLAQTVTLVLLKLLPLHLVETI